MKNYRQLEIFDHLGDESSVPPVHYEITSYGADFLVDGIVKRLQNGDIFIPPFQRSFVWTFKQAESFIESLLLGLPVPGIFLSKDYESQKMLVIDGQQRLRTLQYFYEGWFPHPKRAFVLQEVQSQFVDKTYKTLSDEDRRRLDNSILHATIVQQEKPEGENSSVYHIFKRLNTSGIALTPQEIRASIYFGEYNDVLRTLNNNSDWRMIAGSINRRLKDQELILRFFALFFEISSYRKPMSEFLNTHIARNRKCGRYPVGQLESLFLNTIGIIAKNVGKDAFKPTRALNAAVFDAVMVGLARRLEKGEIKNVLLIREKYQTLLKDKKFQKLVSAGTADEQNVRDRIELATEIFQELP